MALDPGQQALAIANFTNDYNIIVGSEIGLLTLLQNSASRAIAAIQPNPVSGPSISVILANAATRAAQLSDVIVAAVNDQLTELNAILLLDP